MSCEPHILCTQTKLQSFQLYMKINICPSFILNIFSLCPGCAFVCLCVALKWGSDWTAQSCDCNMATLAVGVCLAVSSLWDTLPSSGWVFLASHTCAEDCYYFLVRESCSGCPHTNVWYITWVATLAVGTHYADSLFYCCVAIPCCLRKVSFCCWKVHF